MGSKQRASISDLPNEVLVSIFSLLPITDLVWVASTSERWHGIVTSFPSVWKAKRYRSDTSPAQCPETSAVLRALPSFTRISIQSTNGFMVDVCYPRLVLQVRSLNVMRDFPRLKCEYLSMRLDIASDIFANRTTIDLECVRRLRVLRIWNINFSGPRIVSVEYVARAALLLCPNLRHLSLRTDFVSGEHLETLDGLGRLQYLEIESHELRNLSFLRHCSETLQGLLLVGYSGVPSRELDNLGRLRNLCKLWLGSCQFSEGHMAAILARLSNLVSLHLNSCSTIRDLSVLRHCSRLRELGIVNKLLEDDLVESAGQELQLGGLVPCTNPDYRHLLGVVNVTVTADDLTAALSRLRDRGLPETSLAYLAALRPCSQLRYICCEFTSGLDELEITNVRIHIALTNSA